MAAAAEVQFAQRLASNEKRFRDRAVRKLRRYLSARSQRLSGGFSQEELLKMWKGIFYCMWMQDKPLLQEELANTISQLIHAFKNLDAKFLFMETFFQTMNREWNGIDRLRLDKFYLLIRLMLRQFLEELKSMNWDDSVVNRFLSCVTNEVLKPTSNTEASGIRFHFVDIYLQELAQVGAHQLSADQNLKFIEPFCRIAAKTKDRVLFHVVSQGIFEIIVDQAPFAIDDLINELQGDENEDGVCEVLNSTDKEEGPSLSSKINGFTSEKAEGLLLDGKGEKPNPAQHDDDIGPVLQFNYEALADRLFQLSSRGNTPAQNRKRLYKLVKKFRDLAEGIFPQDDFPEDLSTDEEDEDSWRKKKKRKHRVEKLEEELEGVDKKKSVKRQKRKKKPSKQKLLSVSDRTDELIVEDGSEGSNPIEQEPVQIRKKKLRTTKMKQRLLSDTVSDDHLEVRGQAQKNGCSDQLSPPVLGMLPVTSDVDSVTPTAKLKRRRRRIHTDSEGSSFAEDSAPTEPVVGKKVKKLLVKLRKLQSKKQAGGDQPSTNQAAGRRKRKGKELTEGTSDSKKLKVKNCGDAGPCGEIKTSATTAPDEFVKFESTPIPKPIFFKKAKSAEPVSKQQCNMIKVMSMSSAKKVRFGLKKNTTAEFKRTDKSILVSPAGTSRIAFDPEQKPHHSVLKSNSPAAHSPSILAKRASFTRKGRPQKMDNL
ncbi:ribosomal RNA processing protein 1 homolog A isoform X1 [Stegostoma tigrinum]|uniref:ribosomal RNA processing protein 1 homolog A isoform X1 n=2 Tax=Stegostoma tigrinum TaxID=3053191 RepID=UPI0028702666|nr:ribosomal RNA processing protein 1 homolog A isoform X1 [Stegostoma tigrinum]